MLAIGCDNSTGGGGFVPVTGITATPGTTFVNYPLSLSATVEPANATNRAITWSGNGVSDGVLTATSAGTYTVIATIANGEAEGVDYTDTFYITAINVGYGGGGGTGSNPFGTDATPLYWAMDNMGGEVYIIVKETTWESRYNGGFYNSGDYQRIGTSGALLTVTAGPYTGNTVIALIDTNGKMKVDTTGGYSEMNGTFTKLDTTKTLEGTWISTEPLVNGNYLKITAANDGKFTQSMSTNPSGSTWANLLKGTYPTTGNTNPAACTITEVNTAVFTGAGTESWAPWAGLSQEYKNYLGGSPTSTMIIYDSKFEGMGAAFTKQP